ncbi:MAG: hypothetical protein LBK73_07365 [Treponema sp.]|jgi:ubiquinone/menaquinone biosynthesis C-methylase UbiE|nr:hypothetical protein [Treponema sp.]
MVDNIIKIIWEFDDKDYSIRLLGNTPTDFNGKILDIPAGTGILTTGKYKQLHNSEIICMDYSNDMLEIAKNVLKKII